MCGCNNKENVVDLPHIKIYTNMATYKVKKHLEGTSSTFYGGQHVNWSLASQEVLAHLYEERGMTDLITKTSSNEKSDNKVSKKSSNKKKDAKEE
tara:strand:+ start:1010 stop:1294 length:285 start_codon:yes stop_codon:yes gene_type:complete